ncbi:A24 family peptidase [Roseibium sp.]|uniref:A24 family peptidase n=1 Tax=Roseibium sp. TaxID=1936156 RepID=UPI003B505142
MIEAATLVLFPMLVAFAGASDLFTMKIGNRVSILLIVGFVFLAIASGLSPTGWALHGLGLVVVFVPCFAFFAAGWMGGGDVKLISAISLWFGFTPILAEFLFLVTLLGCLLTLALMLIRSSLVVLPGPLINQDWALRIHDTKSGIPYGIAISGAALVLYPMSVWFTLVSS